LAEFESSEKYTAVALWNCFDQLPDPHAALQHVNELIEPGGWLALRVPNGGFYAHVRSREAGLQRALLAWNNLASFPYRHGFTSKSLRALLDRHGYRVVEQRADTLVSIAGAYTRGWARWEERIVKAGMKLLLPFRLAPWLEVYARRAAS
jgi:hypothetical protein